MTGNIKYNIVLVEGLGFSGSGAVLDLLREVNGCYVLPTEFRIINDPDGLLSLESAIVDNWTVFQGDVAIKRFRKLCQNLSNKYTGPYATLDHTKIFGREFLPVVDRYLDKLTQLEFNCLWYGNDSFLRRKLIARRFIGRNRFTTKKMYVAKNMKRDEFLIYTRDFLSELASLCISDKRIGLFVIDGDYSVLNAKRVMSYLTRGKMILVIRDPRDILSTVRKGLGAYIPYDLENNIKWQLSIYKRWIESLKYLSKEEYIIIRFEELISNYFEVTKNIFSFLKVDSKKHVKKYHFFDPNESIKNVSLWKENLTLQESELIKSLFAKINNEIEVIW